MMLTADELQFFDRMPRYLPVYEVLLKRLKAMHPEMTVRVAKTQISLRSRYVFVAVSLPYRRAKEWPEEYLMISFGLDYRIKSPRIVQSAEAYPKRWTHHVIIENAEQLDEELLSWLDEAYRFSVIK